MGWLLLIALISQFIGLSALAFLILPMLSIKRRNASQVSQLSWFGHQLIFTENDVETDFQWTGRGRRSTLFILWQLTGPNGIERQLVWKDQVSDSSWRALNMAFTVWQSQALQQMTENTKSPSTIKR